MELMIGWNQLLFNKVVVDSLTTSLIDYAVKFSGDELTIAVVHSGYA